MRGFRVGPRRATRPAGELAVIAEVKRRSPSKGDLTADLDPAAAGRRATRPAARPASRCSPTSSSSAARPTDLRAARAAVGVPVLRKDFTVVAGRRVRRPAHGRRRRAADRRRARRRRAAATSTRWPSSSASTCWSRCTTRPSSSGRCAVGATLVGVNQRDLVTFEVDTDRAVRMAPPMPDGVVRVAESGIRGAGRRRSAGRRRLPRRAGRRDAGDVRRPGRGRWPPCAIRRSHE